MCCRFCSALSSALFREKNEAFEAVIGVLGVLALTRRGGGVIWPSEKAGSCPNAAILAAVGVLKGSKFNGGSRSGCKFFFLTGVALFCWSSEFEAAGPYCRALCSRSVFTGSRIDPLPDKLFVDVLLILLASNGILDFRLLKNGGSAGESFGDS